MIEFRSMVVSKDELPSVPQVTGASKQLGVDLNFEDGFDFRANPKNRAGRVAVSINGRGGEIGYAIDPLDLLIEVHELPRELAQHGDALVTFGVTDGFEAVAAAVEREFADKLNAYGWRNEQLVPPDQLARDAEVTLNAAKGQNA